MFFKSTTRNILFFLILLAGFALLGYFAFDWWQIRSKRAELFEYFRQNSPVTKLVPADAFVYINFFDLKRVHSDIEGTRLYDVLAHWIDTGFNDDSTSNPVLGGMLEKTILNVAGEELAVAFVPSKKRPVDVVAVARLSSGSDFIVRLALAQNKQWKRIRIDEETIYEIPTKDENYPEFYIHVNADYAFASSDIDRIQAMMKGPGAGPDFLKNLDSQQIPEDTFVFAQAGNPKLGVTIHGSKKTYVFSLTNNAELKTNMSELQFGDSSILGFQTNATELFHQPSITYNLHLNDGQQQSYLLLGFSRPAQARKYQQAMVRRWAALNQLPQPVPIRNAQCFSLQNSLTVCSKKSNLLLSRGSFKPQQMPNMPESKTAAQPLTLEIKLNPDALSEYLEKIETGDWSHFAKERPLYFLSCVKGIDGGINGSSNEIRASIQ